MQVRRGRNKLLYVLALLFFAGMAVFSGYRVYTILTEYRVGEESAQALQQYVTLQPEAPQTVTDIQKVPATSGESAAAPLPEESPEPTEPAEPDPNYPLVDFAALKEINPDVLGWIYIEGTTINYPIVQGADNDYYLSRLVDGTSNKAGSIFLDYRNTPDFSDYHTVIYGHNMKNGTMFADITEYKKEAFLEAHPVGKIMTPRGNFQIEIIGGYVADLRDPAWELHFETDEDRLEWLRDAMKRSTVGGDYVPVGGEQIITLSTCSYEFDDARFVVICRVSETPFKDK